MKRQRQNKTNKRKDQNQEVKQQKMQNVTIMPYKQDQSQAQQGCIMIRLCT